MSRRDKGSDEVLEGVPLSAEESAQRSAAARVGGGLVGVVAGRVAGRALRPVARRVAHRVGLPASSIERVIAVGTPVVAAVVAGQLAKYRTRRREEPGTFKASPSDPPGPVPLRRDGTPTSSKHH
ncbi:hypothetical protein [Spirillospora sp. NPDC047279]|uniref:hypothetical protein n=1 Tax=Spirillospora sp. NPDC047279 TaxID=3155478 RepID=UPI0033FA2EA6